MIKAGKYKTKAVDYGVTQTKNGDPMLVVKFEVDGQSLFWRGMFGEKSLPITEKALAALGFESDRFDVLADGTDSGALNLNLEVVIEVDLETYNGESRPVVKWVNEPGAGGIRNGISRVEAVNLFQGLRPSAATPKRVDNIPF